MIADAQQIENGATLNADLCIVGGGAAGITLALHCLKAGSSVLLLESGGEREEASTQALYEGEVADPALHAPPDKYRRRAFGGSTALWGGRCVPFDPIECAARPWLGLAAWPIAYADIARHYPLANMLCEAGSYAYTAESAFPEGMRPMLAGFRGRDFTDTTLERFSRPTDFARRYRGELAASEGLRVLLHANVTELLTAGDGSIVQALRVRTLGGRNFTVRTGQVVLAMGGLEIPRLLLASRDRHAAGIGNLYDQVGRFYMCHIAGTLGEIRLRLPQSEIFHGYQRTPEGIYCRRRFALTAEAQAGLGIGNFVARLHHPRIPDPAHRTGPLSALFLAKPFISYEYSKRLHGDGPVPARIWAAHLRNLALDPFATAGFLAHWLRRRSFASRKFPTVIIRSKSRSYSLDFHAEQLPNPASRIQLTQARDALGQQKIRVDWRSSAADLRTVGLAARSLARDLAASGCGIFSFDDQEVAVSALRDGAYGGHHIGTARMSHTPQTGVVDADCRVHGLRNLFIAGSAVFPTSGQANPTLTIVAMALRLAEHLKKEALLF
jgi:choline dehydrogenase-like flavoprotein